MDQTTSPVSPASSEVTWAIAATFWWAWCWRAALVGIGGAMAIGFVFGFVGVILGADVVTITLVSQILGGILGIVVGIYFIKSLLNKDFKTFKVTVTRK